jgi:16S rRNA (guanine966-N2)-methyltransferase
VRIISGSARGRPIAAPPGSDVRPTSDRVREAVFNALFSAGALAGSSSSAVDLFAGSGALGLEALSRGVEHVTFVDRSRAAAAAVGENLETLGFVDGAVVIVSSAEAWLEAGPGGADIVFCDPPYRYDDWERLLILVHEVLSPTVIVVESDTPVELGPTWSVFKTARYASTVVQIARPVGGVPEDDIPQDNIEGAR